VKKILFYSLFLLVSALPFPRIVSADLLPPNSHQFDLCVKVVNLNKFPKIVLIGDIIGFVSDGYEPYQIENNKCLEQGSKHNQLSVYWNIKERGISIDPNNLLLEKINVYGGYVDKDDPLVKKEIEYSLTKVPGGKFVLYESKKTFEYNDGTLKKIEKNNFIEKITKVIKSFFSSQQILLKTKFQKSTLGQNVNCFFKGLAGKGCQ
jgi:hypothetical protein